MPSLDATGLVLPSCGLASAAFTGVACATFGLTSSAFTARDTLAAGRAGLARATLCGFDAAATMGLEMSALDATFTLPSAGGLGCNTRGSCVATAVLGATGPARGSTGTRCMTTPAGTWFTACAFWGWACDAEAAVTGLAGGMTGWVTFTGGSTAVATAACTTGAVTGGTIVPGAGVLAATLSLAAGDMERIMAMLRAIFSCLAEAFATAARSASLRAEAGSWASMRDKA